jgi:signal transduction histidine kinase
MSKPQHKRSQIFVDSRVQGALMLRAVLYWAFCLLTMTIMILVWRTLTGPSRMFYTHFDDMWHQFGPAVIASILLLPIVVIDSIRLSNRFAGPMLRLRRAMRNLAAGEHVPPVHFRDADYWQEFADEFNTLAARVEALTADKHPTEEASAAEEFAAEDSQRELAPLA